MEGLERSPELRWAGTAVKHSSSCILDFVFVFQVGLASNSAPDAQPIYLHCVRFFGSAPASHHLAFETVRVAGFLPEASSSQAPQRHNAAGAEQLSLLAGVSTLRWPLKDGQPEWTLATWQCDGE
jgi:hypothetical protein